MDKVEITAEHIENMRAKYDCGGLTDEQVIHCMLKYEVRLRGGGRMSILEMAIFPSFQSYLNYERSKSLK